MDDRKRDARDGLVGCACARGCFGAAGLPLLSNLYLPTIAVQFSTDPLASVELIRQSVCVGLCCLL